MLTSAFRPRSALERRLARAFVGAGGDLRDARQLDRFAGAIVNVAATLPPLQHAAFEAAIASTADYAMLAADLGLTVSAFRQRVAHAARDVEAAVRTAARRTEPVPRGDGTPPLVFC